MTDRKRVFSGIQPTGKLHIGNYIGALSVWAQEQDNFKGIYCIVDMHAFTIPENINPQVLNEKIWETTAIYLASGIDPKKSTVFRSSSRRGAKDSHSHLHPQTILSRI
jgi:tryptophanyl-tRNA synthetase